MSREKSDYYTYIYHNPLKNNKEFYVGYGGSKDRWLKHLEEARRLIKENKSNKWIRQNCVNPYKIYTIIKILKSGAEPSIIKALENLTKQEAIDEEIRLIELYGRKDKGLGTLTNMTDGGDGSSGIRKDLTGLIYEKLTVIEFDGRDKWHDALWLCRCECGNEKRIRGNSLQIGRTTSCGCIRKGVATHYKLHLTINNEEKTLKEWAKISGNGYDTMRSRIRRGWTDEGVIFGKSF